MTWPANHACSPAARQNGAVLPVGLEDNLRCAPGTDGQRVPQARRHPAAPNRHASTSSPALGSLTSAMVSAEGPPICCACSHVHAGDQMEWQWSGGFLSVVGPEINRCVDSPTRLVGFACLGHSPAEPGRLDCWQRRGLSGGTLICRDLRNLRITVHFPASTLQVPITGAAALGGPPSDAFPAPSNPPPPPPLPCSTHTQYQLAAITAPVVKGQRRLAVSNATRIAVGQWVRLWARKPLNTRRGRSLHQLVRRVPQRGAAALAAQAERAEAARTSARRLQAGQHGFLPLSPAMEEARRQAQVCPPCQLSTAAEMLITASAVDHIPACQPACWLVLCFGARRARRRSGPRLCLATTCRLWDWAGQSTLSRLQGRWASPLPTAPWMPTSLARTWCPAARVRRAPWGGAPRCGSTCTCTSISTSTSTSGVVMAGLRPAPHSCPPIACVSGRYCLPLQSRSLWSGSASCPGGA